MIARQSFRWLFLIIELQPQRLSRVGNRYVVENIYCNVAFEWKFKWNPGYPYSQIPRYKVPPLTHLPWNKMRITITRWYSFRPEKALVCIVRSGSAHSLYVGWLQAGFLNMLKKNVEEDIFWKMLLHLLQVERLLSLRWVSFWPSCRWNFEVSATSFFYLIILPVAYHIVVWNSAQFRKTSQGYLSRRRMPWTWRTLIWLGLW